MRWIDIIAPIVITSHPIRLYVQHLEESGLQFLLAVFVKIKVLQPELTAFILQANRLDNAPTPLFYYCNVLTEQIPEEMTADSIQVWKLCQVLNLEISCGSNTTVVLICSS